MSRTLKVLRTLKVDELVGKDDRKILENISKITFMSFDQCRNLPECEIPSILNETNILPFLATINEAELPMMLPDGTSFTGFSVEWMDFLNKLGIGHPQTTVPA